MILTAIVITMGIAAFVLALTYRSYRLSRARGGRQRPRGHQGLRAVRRVRTSPIDEDLVTHDPHRDTDEPDELDALPGHEGSR